MTNTTQGNPFIGTDLPNVRVSVTTTYDNGLVVTHTQDVPNDQYLGLSLAAILGTGERPWTTTITGLRPVE